MKIRQHEKHLQMFEKQFLQQTRQVIQLTQSNLLQTTNKLDIKNSNMIVENVVQSPYDGPMQKSYVLQKKLIKEQQQEAVYRVYRRKFKLNVKHFVFQVLAAYALTIGLMYLNRVAYFPFFQAIIVVMISLATEPIDITNFFIMLGIPISVANYNIGVWILTYPMIIICYFSRFIFTNYKIKSLFWIVSALVQLIFGFVIIPAIGNSLAKQSKIVLYYLYPWLLVIVKVIVGLINEFVEVSNILLLQVSLFLPGLSYGMLLTLSLSNIQYWYLLVILTLEIINSRYQFLLTFAKSILKIKTHSIMQAHASGYVALNQIHIIVFIYAVCFLVLNTPSFQYNLRSYVTNMLIPFIAWCFCLIYQTISILRLRNSEKFVIIGFSEHTYFHVLIRALGLTLGLWFFFLGLGIPSLIFLS